MNVLPTTFPKILSEAQISIQLFSKRGKKKPEVGFVALQVKLMAAIPIFYIGASVCLGYSILIRLPGNGLVKIKQDGPKAWAPVTS